MAPPVLIGHVKKRQRIRDPGMRTHYVDTAELGHAPLNCPTAVVVNGYVANKLNAPFPEAACGRLQLLSVAIKGDYRRAFIEKALHDRQTDPLRCSRDNDALPTELRHIPTPRLLVC
jgi:hypothetical protein